MYALLKHVHSLCDKESERVSEKNRQTDGEKAFSSSIEEEAARLSSREKEPSAK